MEKKYFADIVINREKLSNGEDIFVAHCVNLGIASQGITAEEAVKNIKEAVELYLEEQPEKTEDLKSMEEPGFFSIIEVKENGKTPGVIRTGIN